MEIERKYLVKNLPEHLSDYPICEMEQAYISTAPVVRVRKKIKSGKAEYILTIKSTGMMSREEYELAMTEDEYENLLKKADGNVITKNRYLIKLDDVLTLELDVFEGAFKGLVIAEIEFPNEELANSYTPPDFLDEDVTFDGRFHNSRLSSMPKEDIEALLQSLT